MDISALPRPEELEPHPIALLFPPLSPEQTRELANDIKAKGLLHDIWLYEDAVNGGEKKPYILDGRSRNEACVIERIEARYQFYQGTDPLGFAVSLNERRRHMSLADRKSLAKRIAEYNPAITDRELARSAGLGSHITAGKARQAKIAPTSHTDDVNGQNGHYDSPATTEVTLPDPPPAPRVEASGKKARGRKPSSSPKLAKSPKEFKPKPIESSRDTLIVAVSSRLKSDRVDTLHALAMLVEDDEAANRKEVSEHTRRLLMGKFAKGLGFVIPGAESGSDAP